MPDNELATSTSSNHNSVVGQDRSHHPAEATGASCCSSAAVGPPPAPLLCEDVLIDVCRWLTRRQLATSIAPAAGRQCWHRLFQPGQPLSVWPKHLAQELYIGMDGNFGEQPSQEYFCVNIRSKCKKQRNCNLFPPADNDIENHEPAQFSGHHVSLPPPDFLCFKVVRLHILALCEERSIDEHCLLDTQKLAFVESLFNTFHGPVTTLFCWYMSEEFDDRADLSEFLSHEFFDRFFAKFEIVKFTGDTLPTKQPLLLLPGLIRCKRRLLFECNDSSDFVRDDFFMFGVNEISSWLNYASEHKERILYIREIGFIQPPEALFWMENLLTRLKECLLGSTKMRPYTLYIDGPMFDWPIENDQQFGGLPRGLVARNPCTCEQLLFDAFDPDHDKLPSGNEFIIDSMLPKPLGMFRRMNWR